MMKEFAYFCRMNIPWTPPFVVLVILFMILSIGLYCYTKQRGYLVTCLSGFCYMVPWLLQCVLR